MTFKETVAQDVQTTFLNEMEFADIHTINNVPMACIVDNNERIERVKRFSQNMDGLYTASVFVYVSASVFDEHFHGLPTRGASMSFDGELFRVAEAIDEYGVYCLALEASDSMGMPQGIRGLLP